MAKYLTRNEEVEAFQFDGDLIDSDGINYVPDWAMDLFNNGILRYDSIDGVDDTLTNLFLTIDNYNKLVNVGDYVVKIGDKYFECDGCLFENLYRLKQ